MHRTTMPETAFTMPSTGQIISVRYQGQAGSFTQMFLNDHPPVAGGRKLWAFRRTLLKDKGALALVPAQ
jgi:acetoacetate decarboxylase